MKYSNLVQIVSKIDIHDSVEKASKKFKEFFNNTSNSLSNVDLEEIQPYLEESLESFSNLDKNLKAISAEVLSGSTALEKSIKDSFMKTNLLSIFKRELNSALAETRSVIDDFAELSSLGGLSAKINANDFIIASAYLGELIKNQNNLIQNIISAYAKDDNIPEEDKVLYFKNHKQIQEQLTNLKSVKIAIDREKRISERMQKQQARGLSAVYGQVFSAISDVKNLYLAVRKGSLSSAENFLESLKIKLETASRMHRQAKKLRKGGAFSSTLSSILASISKGLLSIVEGLEFIVKPMSLFFSVGVFGLAALIYKAINAVNKFSREIVETRGAYQLQYSINFNADSRGLESSFMERQQDFLALMNNYDYKAGENFNNIYQISEEQYKELNKMTSGVNLERMKKDIGKGISTQKAEFSLNNDVIKFSYGLSTDFSDIAKYFDESMNDLQYKYQTASLSLAYLSQIAQSGNLSSYKLFNAFRRIQGSMSSLNTRVTGTINLLALLQKSQAMSEGEQEKFVKDAESFVSDSNEFVQSVSNGIITEDDLRLIFADYKSSNIIKNQPADRLAMSIIDSSLDSLNRGNIEAVFDLQNIIKTDPSLSFNVGLAAIRRRLMSQGVDIFAMSSFELVDYANKNVRQIGLQVGAEYENFAYSAIIRLAEIKKRSGEKARSMKDILYFERVDSHLKGKESDAEEAKDRSLELEQALVKQRAEIQNMFNAQKNFLGMMLLNLGQAIRSMFQFLTGAFAFFKDPSWEGWRYFTMYGSFDTPMDLLNKHRQLNMDLRSIIMRSNGGQASEADSMEAIKKIKEIDEIEQRFGQLSSKVDVSAYKNELSRQRIAVPKSLLSNRRLAASAASGDVTDPSKYRSGSNRETAKEMIEARDEAYRKFGKDNVERAKNSAYQKLNRHNIRPDVFSYVFYSLLKGSDNLDRASELIGDFLTAEESVINYNKRAKIESPDMSIQQTFNEIHLDKNNLSALSSILGKEADPAARRAFLRAFFKAAAKHPGAMSKINLEKDSSASYLDKEVIDFYKDLEQESGRELSIKNVPGIARLRNRVIPRAASAVPKGNQDKGKADRVIRPEGKLAEQEGAVYPAAKDAKFLGITPHLPDPVLSAIPKRAEEFDTLGVLTFIDNHLKKKSGILDGLRGKVVNNSDLENFLLAEVTIDDLQYYTQDENTGEMREERDLRIVSGIIKSKSIKPTNEFIRRMKEDKIL
ncbi:hypothetical protein EBS02_02055 [bacterium]|nr:hypothetical protein [bacterium]